MAQRVHRTIRDCPLFSSLKLAAMICSRIRENSVAGHESARSLTTAATRKSHTPPRPASSIKLMSPTNSYRILELSVGASQPDVRAAYHRLVRQWHPDKFHDDPDTKIIAERKIREIIGAYTHLSNSDVTQRHADVVPDDATDADRSEHSPPRSSTNDVFYTNLEEAIRSGTSTFAGQPQDSSADTASTRQQAATESQGTGRAACAYVDGDPRLEHISTGLLGCAAAITWNSAGVTLNTENGTSVSYPARSIRSVRLALRSSLAFLSEGLCASRSQILPAFAMTDFSSSCGFGIGPWLSYSPVSWQ